MDKKKISVVIGLYNSSKTICTVLDELASELKKLDKYEYEIILVNDCGPDNVLDIACEEAKKDSRIKVISLAKNSGQTNAVITGYTYATGDYIVEMDDDFQMPAYEIGKMLSELEEKDLDVVFAKYEEQKESGFRLFGSSINQKMTEIMIGKPRDITINSFFVMRKCIKDSIIQYQNNYPYVYGIIFASTGRIGNVVVEHRARTNGSSNYTFKSLLGLWMNGFLNFSIKPLRIATLMGLTVTGISFIIALVLVIMRLLNPDGVMGWTSLIVTIIFFAGIQLLGIGVIGEYLGRLYISASKLPRTVVRETFNIESDEKKVEK